MNSLSTLRITLAALACLWACSEPNSGEIHQGTTSDGASEFDAGLGDAQDNDAPTSADTTGADSAVADAKPIDAAAPDSSPADGVITPDAVPDAIADANSDTAVAPDAGADAAVPACCGPSAACPAGWTCNRSDNLGECVAPPPSGKCWKNADCPSGQSCHGAAFCPCNSDCDMPYQGPGICVPPAPACAPIQPGWVKEICNAKGLVVWDGSNCVATCPGCCGCEPFCDKTFATMAECQASCKTCPVWNGACDDALPAQPWWARMASGCVAVSSCLNPGTPGTYATQKACIEACP